MHELRPRCLLRVARLVRDGLPSAGRYRRYAALLIPALALIWLATGAYLALAPPRYTSHFTLILPGSGAGGTLNVESIGQAQSTASSAFSSPTLSPTENYKRLLMADVTVRQAARSIGVDGDRFPIPGVMLIDQTNLITAEVAEGTPAAARRAAEALRTAFLDQLNRLRADEAALREISDARHLKDLEAKVRAAQRKLIAFQAENGLVSLDQFNSRIAALDALRDKEREMRTTLRQDNAETGRFATALGMDTGGANLGLRLKSDPQFQQLLDRFATLDSDATQKSATLGPEHGDRVQAESERDALRTALARRGHALTGLSEAALMRQIDLSVSDGRSGLLAGMITSDVHRSGAGAALAEIRGDLAQQQARASGLVTHASVLADLTRDHRIAEAVFSSALARLDTNKQDPYASYPLVQTLEAPSIPRAPSSPVKLIVVGAALAATFLMLTGCALLWLRQPIIRKIFPKS